MKVSELRKLLDQAVQSSGNDRVVAALENLAATDQPEKGVLTIVSNAGIHSIPEAFLRGEIYEASRGDWDVSTEEALKTELTRILARLVIKLHRGRLEARLLDSNGSSDIVAPNQNDGVSSSAPQHDRFVLQGRFLFRG